MNFGIKSHDLLALKETHFEHETFANVMKQDYYLTRSVLSSKEIYSKNEIRTPNIISLFRSILYNST